MGCNYFWTAIYFFWLQSFNAVEFDNKEYIIISILIV